ncbi:MAG: YqaA family protein [Gammaproteobacteria bacterium]|jgi:membrane protein YqaA with SNARE-associated domain
MRIFSRLYARVMHWSGHPHAPWYLFGLAFAESSFFPIPPDVMLMPMTLATPQRGYRFAALATLGSVLGGIAGWTIGYFAFEAVMPLLHEFGYWQSFLEVKSWFAAWGFWAVLLAGFSPIPYKVFTIAAGVMIMPLPAFVAASIVGRGGRFFLVTALVRWGGPKVEHHLRRHIDVIGWATVILAVAVYAAIKLG